MAHGLVQRTDGTGHHHHPGQEWGAGAYLSYLPTSLALCLSLAVAVAALVALGKRRLGLSPRSFWLFGLVPVLGYAGHALGPALGGDLSVAAGLGPALLVGLMVQLPFALVAVALGGTILLLADRLAGLLRHPRAHALAIMAAEWAADTPPGLTQAFARGVRPCRQRVSGGTPAPGRHLRIRRLGRRTERGTTMSPMTTAGRTIAALAAALCAALLVVPAAFAHSVLIGTDPESDVVLAEAPADVVLTFNEPVDASLGSLRVLDGQGRRVDDGDVTQPQATVIEVGIDGDLAAGTYTAAYRAVSADSHPISGAFVFHVQERGPSGEAVSLAALTGTAQSVDALFTATKFFDLALLLLVVGGSLSVAVVLAAAARRLLDELLGVLAGLAGGLMLAALASIVLQGATASGLGIREALSWRLFRAVVDTDYGEVMILQAALAGSLALAAQAARHARNADERHAFLAIMLVLCGALVLTPSLSGHARTLGAVGLLSDVLHVASAAVWAGGLAFLLLALRRAGGDRWPLAARAVPRFSNLAVGSVVVLLAAGTVSAYLEIRSWAPLWETRYGLLVLAKIALASPLVALGAYNNRRAVPRLRRQLASARERRRFLRTIAAELVILAAVVAVTAVLIGTPPARSEAAFAAGNAQPAEPAPSDGFEEAVQLGGFTAQVVVEPAEPGDNSITITLFREDDGPEVTEVGVSASLPGEDIGPLEFPAEPDPDGPDTYVVEAASLPIAGEWEVRIEVLLGRFDLVTQTITVPIAGS